MESKIEVRLAQIKDVSALVKLAHNLYGIELSEGLVEWKLKNNQELIVVATHADKVIGFTCAQVKMSFCRDELIGEITELYVEKAYRQKSVANSMLNLIESYFENQLVGKVTGSIMSSNTVSQQVFKGMGYDLADYCVYEKQFLNI